MLWNVYGICDIQNKWTILNCILKGNKQKLFTLNLPH